MISQLIKHKNIIFSNKQIIKHSITKHYLHSLNEFLFLGLIGRTKKILYFKSHQKVNASNEQTNINQSKSPEEDNQKQKKVIQLSSEEIQKMMSFMEIINSDPLIQTKADQIEGKLAGNQGENNQQINAFQDFFDKQEHKLSLQIMKTQSIQQLQILLKQYQHKNLIQSFSNHPSSESKNSNPFSQDQQSEQNSSTIRCKFMLIYKYINLEGKVQDQQIQTLLVSVCQYAHLLDEEFLLKFMRIVVADAHHFRNNLKIKNVFKAVPFIKEPTHTNSQIVSLLIMMFPTSTHAIWKHYQLNPMQTINPFDHNKNNQIKNVWIIYDPIHLVHILSNFNTNDHSSKNHQETININFIITQLLVRSLNYINQNDQLFQPEKSINSFGMHQRSKAKSIMFGLQQNLTIIQDFVFSRDKLSIKFLTTTQILKILEIILASTKYDRFEKRYQTFKPFLIEMINTAINKAVQQKNKNSNMLKQEAEQEIDQENNVFMKIIEFLTIILTKHKSLVAQIPMDLILNYAFDLNNAKGYQAYDVEELFKIIVCFCGWKKYFNGTLPQNKSYKNPFRTQVKGFDIMRQEEKGQSFLKTLVEDYKQRITAEINVNKMELFYVCYFANQNKMLDSLVNAKIIKILKIFSQQNKQKPSFQSKIQRIIKDSQENIDKIP